MTDHRNPDSERLVAREPAPDHGPNFWTDLEAAIGAEPQAATEVDPADRTAPLPRVEGPARVGVTTPGSPPTAGSRRMWPLAAAAAVVAVLGLGLLALRITDDPATTTEIVAAPTTSADGAPLDGPDGEADDLADSTESVPPTDTPAPDGEPVDSAPATTPSATETTDSSTSQTPAGSDSDTTDTTSAPAASAVPAIPDFALAPGATGTPDFLPLDQGIPADGTFLADWPERGLSWYAVTDPDTTCANAGYAEIRYVNASGITQKVRDPQLRFSGEISHFTVSDELDRAAWVAGCGTQLELYVANLRPTGQIADLRLVWLGQGTIDSALVLWADDEVSLNAIEPGGTAFAVAYDIETEIVSRNGGPSRIMLEAGAPADRSLTPLAATPDGGLTYWTGGAPTGAATACPELYGTDRGDTLWLRQGEGQWQSAVSLDFPMATVMAAALEVESLQLAFADVCDGGVGRVVVGSVLADGRLGDLREIDLTPYVPGFASQLHWVDADTLRIETDNTEFGVEPVRFDFRLADGVIVQLD